MMSSCNNTATIRHRPSSERLDGSSGWRNVVFNTRFSLYKLEVFCRVVDTGGVGKAAESLYVTQSVVSAHLRSLQDHLDVQLFERDGRGVRLTVPGRTVYAWARDTLTRTRRVARELEGIATGESTTVTVAADASLASYVLPAIICELQARQPDTLISIEGCNCHHAIATLGDGRSDLAVVMSPDRRLFGDLVGQEIGREDLVLVGDAHAMRDPAVSMTPVALITSSADSLPTAEILPALAGRGHRRARVVARLAHPEAVKLAVRGGLGVALLPRSAVVRELAGGELYEIPLSSPLSLYVYAVLSEAPEPLSVEQTLIDLLQASLAAPCHDDPGRAPEPLYAQLTAVA
jgi:LysR family transcriptional regulator, low CO2-responsive transcriptional regulator